MKIDLTFISHNRLHYTKYSMPALLADPSEEFSLTIWDNASTDGSRHFLESVNDPRIVKKVFSPTNVHPLSVCNQAVSESSADLFGLVAEDLLVTPGWTRTLGAAHADIPDLGRLACWHLGPGTLDYERAKHKIQTFGRHKILRHPWTNGCGLAKIEALRRVGPNKPGDGDSAYWMRMALAGYVVGFYCPPVPVEHMDYPWASHFPYKDRFEDWVRTSITPTRFGFKSFDDAKTWHRFVLRGILDGPWEANRYAGWRGKLMRARGTLRSILLRERW